MGAAGWIAPITTHVIGHGRYRIKVVTRGPADGPAAIALPGLGGGAYTLEGVSGEVPVQRLSHEVLERGGGRRRRSFRSRSARTAPSFRPVFRRCATLLAVELVIWLLAFGLTAVPIGGLLLDRLFDVPARRYFAVLGVPWLVLVAAFLLDVGGGHLAALLVWGAVGGILGTIALDAVRLAGVRAGAFPLDMPKMFGVLLAGLAPQLQRNLIARMVEVTAALPEDDRRRALAPRIAAMGRLSEGRRSIVAAGMFAGLSRLPEELRQAMLSTQLSLLAAGTADTRQAVMGTMTRAMSGSLIVPYGQPRGMPKVPMAMFRALAEVALGRTVEDTGLGWPRFLLLGYGWHVLMGATLGAQYTLLVGSGSLTLAIAWGVFVWLVMMVLMPPMMPMVRFPAWFPVVPFIAHVAFALPVAWVALTLLPLSATAASLLGLLGFGAGG